jgi:pimeloyl-ACP methyl ester carboxylesterase
VPADWYIPDSAEPPTRLIYLQHGFLAQGPWYSHTAAALAEQTNSIVVAPSITSNFLSCDACWLGAPPMQQAVANLFEDDNTALADSALAAGYTGPIPDRVVLVGHSLGGGLVAGTAGYMAHNGTADRLAGVIMLDGVGLDDTMTSSLEKFPDCIPIYQLAAPKYFWNQFGVGTDALLEARPDRFIGVTVVGGSHVDSMRGGNPLIQFSQELVAGYSRQENAAAAQMLMVGWANDMFARQDDGIYPTPARSSRWTPLRERPPWLRFPTR